MSEADSGPEKDNASETPVVETAPQTEEQVTLDDALANALNASDQSDADSEDAQPEEGDAPDEAPDQDDEEGDPEDAGPDENAADDAEPEEAEDGEPEEALSAPDHWPADKREAFDGLPNEAKQVLLDQSKALEAQFTRKNQEVSEQVRFAGDVRELAAPYEQQLQVQGMTTLDGIRQLVGLNDYYQRDPAGYIKYVAQAAGVDLQTLAQNPADAEDEFADPQMAALNQKVHSLQQNIVQQQQVAQTATTQQAQQAINQFASETDPQGQLLRPHFDKVKPRMGALMQSGAATSLEEAYDQAVWSDPTIREQITAAEQQKAAQAAKAQQQAALDKARRNKRKPKGTTPPATSQIQPKDLDSIISAAQAEHT